ncbi:MAG: GGDEF domain-containing protein [Methylophagaceae bacterium]
MSIGLIIASIVPLIVAPLITINLNSLLFQTLELEAKMRIIASTDYLTQLLNRREWIEQSTRYINLATRNNSSFAVLMLDLDNFKAVNDSYGHVAGDKALVLFGEIIQTVSRSSDISGRFGGEEFIILLPDTSAEQAVQFTERLHHHTRSLNIEHGKNILTLTTSIGVSINVPDKPFDLDTLISHADKALYQAKHQGKNCTVVFQQTT